MKFHAKILSTLGVENNAVCQARISQAILGRIREAGLRFDYQLVLDGFSQIQMSSFEELSSYLQMLASLSRITVIEIPRIDL